VSELRRLANEHWLEAYQSLIAAVGGTWREFGSVAAFATEQVPVAFANGCLVVDSATAGDLEQAARWVDGHGLPYRIRIDTDLETDDLMAVSRSLGLARDEWAMPGMVLTPIPPIPEPPSAIAVERVGAANHSDFIRLIVEAGLPHAIALKAFAPPAARDSDDVAMFVAYLDGALAGTAVAVRTGTVAGVYTVGTAESARRRGVGTAATWAAVQQAADWGVGAVVLQASRLGASVYERMGFRTVVEYAVYTAAPAPPP
jgi:GNAT superfamily N-acetyltransferase